MSRPRYVNPRDWEKVFASQGAAAAGPPPPGARSPTLAQLPKLDEIAPLPTTPSSALPGFRLHGDDERRREAERRREVDRLLVKSKMKQAPWV